MSKKKDWWPTTREGQLAMAQKWANILADVPPHWKIDKDEALSFIACKNSAEKAFKTVNNENTCNSITREQYKEAFKQLTVLARDMKRQYFTVPPLKDEELIALGLKIPDRKPTPSGTPTGQAMVKTFLEGRYELGFEIVFWSGDPDDKANKGYRIFYQVTAPGENAPTHPSELRESYFTSKKRGVLHFDPADRGKICHIAVQIENGSKKGPWGPIVSDFIP